MINYNVATTVVKSRALYGFTLFSHLVSVNDLVAGSRLDYRCKCSVLWYNIVILF